MTSRLHTIGILALVALVATATPVSAQQQPGPQLPGTPVPGPLQPGQRRPNRGLFGGGVGDTSQSLTMELSLGGAFVEDLTPGGGPARQDGTASANLAYSLGREFGKLSVGASAGSNGYYYPAASDDLIFGHRAALSATLKASSRTVLSAHEWLSYTPQNVTAFYPVGVSTQQGQGPVSDPSLDPAFNITRRNYFIIGTTLGLTQQISRRASLLADYSRNETNVSVATGRNVFQLMRGGFSYNLAKGVAFRAGYGSELRYRVLAGEQFRYRGRAIDAGIDFNRALSISRRTTVGFSTGATGVDNTAGRRYFVTGAAHFNYEIGRSWTANMAYRRDVQYVDTITDPLIGDSVTFDVGGLISRRVQIRSMVGSRTGRFGTATGSPEFRSSHVGLNLSYAITRYLALRTDYSYFRYHVGSGAVLPTNIRPRMERQSLRVTLNAWVPLIIRRRSTNASR
jgi:hypothetical protein